MSNDPNFRMVDYQKWVREFESKWEDKPVEYLDETGNWNEDSDPLFGSVSEAIQSRDQISKEELKKISEWKLQSSRNERWIEQNARSDIERQSRVAIRTDSDGKAIDALTQLTGVGVPLASTILTMAEPSEYAIIDYRAFRGLAAARPHLVDPDQYSALASFLEHFRTYQKRTQAYTFFMEQVREIAQEEGLTARKVDMALWALDQGRG